MKRKMSATKRNLWIDLLIVVSFLLATQPQLTGMTIHEWLSLTLAAGLLTHLLLHWRWVYETIRRFFSRLARQARLNLLLNLALLIAFTLIIFTGLMISEEVLPFIGLRGVHGGVWQRLHTTVSDLSIWLVGLHLALHWKWIVNATQKYMFGWLSKRKTAVLNDAAATS